MELRPAPLAASKRCIVRAQRIAHVKFMALPLMPPGEDCGPIDPQRFARDRHPVRISFLDLLSRVIGRLVAARP